MIVKLRVEDMLQDQLSWLCIEPMLLAVRAKSPAAKLEMYQQLNEAQQAMYMFYSFHNHVHSPAEYNWFAHYYMSELKGWSWLKSGLHLFEGLPLLHLLEDTEMAIERYSKQEDGAWNDAKLSDLEQDADLQASMMKLFRDYQSSSAMLIQHMNQYIREHAADFLEIE